VNRLWSIGYFWCIVTYETFHLWLPACRKCKSATGDVERSGSEDRQRTCTAGCAVASLVAVGCTAHRTGPDVHPWRSPSAAGRPAPGRARVEAARTCMAVRRHRLATVSAVSLRSGHLMQANMIGLPNSVPLPLVYWNVSCLVRKPWYNNSSRWNNPSPSCVVFLLS